MPISLVLIQNSVHNHTLSLNNKEISDDDIHIICEYLDTNPKITSLNLSQNAITDTGVKILAEKVLRSNKTLVSLDLSENQIGDTGAQILLATDIKLTELNLSSNKITAEGVSHLPKTTTLRALNVRYNHIHQIGIAALSRNDCLESLGMYGNDFSFQEDPHSNHDKKNNTLELHFHHLGHKKLQTICDYLESHKDITNLSLSANWINEADISLLAANKTLKTLRLVGNGLGDLAATALARHESLESLDLCGNNIGDAGALALSKSSKLTTLNLFCNKIGDVGARALAGNKQLKVLDLGNNLISDEAVADLAAQKPGTYLEAQGNRPVITSKDLDRWVTRNWLTLHYNLGNDGIKVISDYLIAHPHITRLSLALPGLTDDEVTLLSSNKNLRILRLRCNLGNSAALILASNKTLVHLDLFDNPIGDEGAIALSKSTLVTVKLSCHEMTNKSIIPCVESKKSFGMKLRGTLSEESIQAIEKARLLQLRADYYPHDPKICDVPKTMQPEPENNIDHNIDHIELEKKVAPVEQPDNPPNFFRYTRNNKLTLDDLRLSHSDVSNLCEFLENDPEIKSISLNRCDIDDKGAIALSKVKTITELSLQTNRIGDAGAIALANNKTLHTLNISDNQIGAQGITTLVNCESFKALSLYYNKAPLTMEQLDYMVRKNELQIFINTVNDSDMHLICDYLQANPNIKSLKLSGCGGLTFEQLRILSENKTLEELDLSHNKLGEKEVKTLASHPNLKRLHLEDCMIGDEGVSALLESETITHLFLEGNNISNKGAMALAQSTTLKYIFLGFNPEITDEGAMALLKNESFRFIHLHDSEFNEETYNYLQKRRAAFENELRNLKGPLMPPARPLAPEIPQVPIETHNKTNTQLEKILECFNCLHDKKEYFLEKQKTETDNQKKLNYEAAANALTKILSWLKNPIDQYKNGTIDLDALKKSVALLLDTPAAKSEIQIINNHRELKQFWIDFIAAIFTFGVSLIYKSVTGHSLFKVKTHAEDLMDEFKQSMNLTPGS